MNKKCIFIIFMACILVLGACFSAWKEDEGTISISIGGGEAFGRAAGTAGGANTDGEEGFPWPDEVSHTIKLSGGSGSGPNRSGIKGGETVHFSVAPGQWTITIEALYRNEPKPYAEGSRTVNIKPGPNGLIVIPMSLKVIKGDDYIDGNNNGTTDDGDNKAGTLRWAIEVVQETSKDIVIVIDLDNDSDGVINLMGTLPDIKGKSVTIRAKNEVTIKRATPNFTASLFTIREDGTLTLGGAGSAKITIDGSDANATEPLITINAGTLIMNDDVTLQNNTNNNGNGGGVAVNNNGTFTMNGGTIKGNTAAGGTATPSTGGYGGGVYVAAGGKFTMNGGTIGGDKTTEGNTADSYGGGVYITGADSEFTMNNGKISGNTANEGGGVCVADNGIFIMSDGEISGNTLSSDNDGGGVLVDNGIFRIAGGTIYGSDNNDLTNQAGKRGAALYNRNGTAQYGKFDGDTWAGIDLLDPNIPYMDNTIKVVDGVLIPNP